MQPGPLNIRITRGSTAAAIVLNCYSDAGHDTPCNLTGYSAFAEVRKNAGGTLIVNLAPTITNAANGEVTIPAMTPTQTTALPAGGYLWDLILQKPSGERSDPILAGAYVVSDKVTSPV